MFYTVIGRQNISAKPCAYQLCETRMGVRTSDGKNPDFWNSKVLILDSKILQVVDYTQIRKVSFLSNNNCLDQYLFIIIII